MSEAVGRPSLHFTYLAVDANGDLQQGDLLKRSESLDKIIEKFHPYYLKADYSHFLVLTQSCDLVRRSSSSSIGAPYITLAAVRPFSIVIEREADSFRKNWVVKRADALERKHLDRLRMFVAKVLNNNLSEYFYLHQDLEVGLQRSLCAFLRLSVAIRPEHYDVCRSSRIASLSQTFQSKLGWHLGNLYARVGTDDWVPKKLATEKEFNAEVDKLIHQHVYFVDDRKVEHTKKNRTEQSIGEADAEAVRQIIASAPEWKKRDDVIAATVEQLMSAGIVSSGEQAEKVRTQLKNNSVLKGLLG